MAATQAATESQGADAIVEERGEHLTSGGTDFDHKYLGRMERHILLSLNPEHFIYGNTPLKDVPKVKARASTLVEMALIGAGDTTGEMELEARSAEMMFTEGVVPRGAGGFERKAGISTQSFNYTIDGSRQGGGILSRLKHPLGGGQAQPQGVQ